MLKLITAVLLLAASAIAQSNPAPVLTYHNTNRRTGFNPTETVLTWANVNPATFKLLFRYPVDGQIYAQPLYLPNLLVNGTPRQVVFAATENNSVYALDAATNTGPNGGVLWQTNFNSGPPGVTVTPVPSGDLRCGDLAPVVGITSTPVLDPATNTLYVVAKTKEVSAAATRYVHRLHALDAATGAEKFGGPVEIQGSVPGSCGMGDGAGNIVFDPKIHHQRAGLALVNGVVYVAFAAHCDVGNYNGWIMGYRAGNLQQAAVLNTSPDAAGGCRAGIWQAGGAPAADPQGRLFVMTGNGGFNANRGGRSFGMSYLELTPGSSGGLSVTDYFTPFNQAGVGAVDLDFGGSSPMLLPPQAGTVTNLAVGVTKYGTIYVLSRDNMGKFRPFGDAIVQSLPNAVSTNFFQAFPGPAFALQRLYTAGSQDTLKAFQFAGGQFSSTPVATSTKTFGAKGAGLSITSDTTGANLIVWALDTTGALSAFKGTDLSLLFSGPAGSGVKYAVPTVSGGRVFTGGSDSLAVYGNY